VTSALPTYTTLMDQACAAVAELDTAIAECDAEIALALLVVDKLKADRRALVEQRRPIAAIIPGSKPGPGRPSTGTKPAPVPQTCPHCGKARKHLAVHLKRCAPPVTEDAPTAPVEVDLAALRPAVGQVVAEPSLLERDVARIFEQHHRESTARRLELAADATGQRLPVVREIARTLGLI
jgi:hypothetical protein